MIKGLVYTSYKQVRKIAQVELTDLFTMFFDPEIDGKKYHIEIHPRGNWEKTLLFLSLIDEMNWDEVMAKTLERAFYNTCRNAQKNWVNLFKFKILPYDEQEKQAN